jgi:peptide/nickel transport system substrate-binding protein
VKKIIIICAIVVVGLAIFFNFKPTSSSVDETSAPQTAQDTSSGALTIGMNVELTTLDSAFSYDTSMIVVIQITESFLYYDENDQLQNGLCESWEEVDGLTYVYNVRDGVKFSDGSPMTMEDVMFSLSRYRNPELASPLAWMYDNVDSIEQTGDWQFTVKLKQADALWKHTFATTAGHVHNKAFIEKAGGKYGTPEGGVLGTGPYTLTRWDTGNEVVLDYNENYWNKDEAGEPSVKHVVFQIIPEDASRLLASTSGQIDLNLFTPVEMLGDVEASDRVSLRKIPSVGLEFLAFNCKKAPFDDVNVRLAVAHAIDAASLQENIVKDYGSMTNYLPVPSSLFLFERETWENYERTCDSAKYDIEKAKAALARSSRPDGFECTIAVDEQSINNSVALFAQQALAEIGIKATINKLSNDELINLQFGANIDDNGVRPYDIILAEWASDFPDPSGVMTPLYLSTGGGNGGSNASCYANARIDELLLAQAASIDPKERTDLMLQALDIINAEVPYYIWAHQNYLFTVNNRIKSGVSNLTGIWFWNIYVKNIEI